MTDEQPAYTTTPATPPTAVPLVRAVSRARTPPGVRIPRGRLCSWRSARRAAHPGQDLHRARAGMHPAGFVTVPSDSRQRSGSLQTSVRCRFLVLRLSVLDGGTTARVDTIPGSHQHLVPAGALVLARWSHCRRCLIAVRELEGSVPAFGASHREEQQFLTRHARALGGCRRVIRQLRNGSMELPQPPRAVRSNCEEGSAERRSFLFIAADEHDIAKRGEPKCVLGVIEENGLTPVPPHGGGHGRYRLQIFLTCLWRAPVTSRNNEDGRILEELKQAGEVTRGHSRLQLVQDQLRVCAPAIGHERRS